MTYARKAHEGQRVAVKAVKEAALGYGLRQRHCDLSLKSARSKNVAGYLHRLRSAGNLDEHIARVKDCLLHDDRRGRQRRVAAELASHHLQAHRAAGVFGHFEKAYLLGFGITLHEECGNAALIFSRHEAVYDERYIA